MTTIEILIMLICIVAFVGLIFDIWIIKKVDPKNGALRTESGYKLMDLPDDEKFAEYSDIYTYFMNHFKAQFNVKVKKLDNTATIPTKGSAEAAGMDLYADLKGLDTVSIEPHQTVMIGTGLAMELPDGYWGGIFARSGLAIKQMLRPGNCTGM